MRRLSKSEIRFRLASFSFFTLLDADFKVSSDSGLNTVAFRSCISNGKPEELLYLTLGFLYLITGQPVAQPSYKFLPAQIALWRVQRVRKI